MKSLIFTVVALSSLSALSSTVKKYEECKILDYKTISQFSYKTGKVLTIGITEKSLTNGDKIIQKALVDSTEASTRSRERLDFKVRKLEIFADKNCQRIDDRTASI
jgi:hypothetical protein